MVNDRRYRFGLPELAGIHLLWTCYSPPWWSVHIPGVHGLSKQWFSN